MSTPLSRRLVLAVLGAGGLAGAIGVTSSLDGETEAPILAPGMAFGRWQVVAVNPVRNGSLRIDAASIDAVNAERADDHFALEIMARDTSGASPTPPAEAGDIAIYLRNGGDGSLATIEDHGLAAMALVQHLDAQGAATRITGLLTHHARSQEHHAVLHTFADA